MKAVVLRVKRRNEILPATVTACGTVKKTANVH